MTATLPGPPIASTVAMERVQVPVPAPASPPRPSSGRLAALDGLRGLAALVVVVHHCALTLPALAAQWMAPDRAGLGWWATYTPLHLVWAGDEAVLVFFVLSGLVLTLPFLSGTRAGAWPAYYRKRAVRLYVPVIAAVAFTAAVIAVFPRTGGPGWSWWMAEHVVPEDPAAYLADAGLLGGTSWRNSVLWSLRIEVWFSIALPLYVVLVRGLRTPLRASLPVVLAAMGWASWHGHDLLSLLCVFAVGALLARRLDALARHGRRLVGSALGWGGVLVVAAGLLMARWELAALGADPRFWVPVGRPAATLGAVLLVFAVLHCRPVRTLCTCRPLQWLGAISFSLYLVHEPIVVTLATLTPVGVRGFAVVAGIGIPLSLLVAVVFSRLVERPSRRVAAAVAGTPLRSGP